jgi:hypothetical protein
MLAVGLRDGGNRGRENQEKQGAVGEFLVRRQRGQGAGGEGSRRQQDEHRRPLAGV